jgi:hypothetical protein
MISKEAVAIFIPRIPRTIPVEGIARLAIRPLNPYLEPDSIARREIRHYQKKRSQNGLAVAPGTSRKTKSQLEEVLDMPVEDGTPVTRLLHRVNRRMNGDIPSIKAKRISLGEGTPATLVIKTEEGMTDPVARDSFVTAEISPEITLVDFTQPLGAVA